MCEYIQLSFFLFCNFLLFFLDWISHKKLKDEWIDDCANAVLNNEIDIIFQHPTDENFCFSSFSRKEFLLILFLSYFYFSLKLSFGWFSVFLMFFMQEMRKGLFRKSQFHCLPDNGLMVIPGMKNNEYLPIIEVISKWKMMSIRRGGILWLYRVCLVWYTNSNDFQRYAWEISFSIEKFHKISFWLN